MSIRFRHSAPAFLQLVTAMLAATPALAGSWQNSFSGFGTTIAGDLYTPTTPGTNPAVMVAMHYCGGSANDAQGWFKSAADQYGFYIITPHAGAKCFNAYATRDATKEPAQIVKMVQWVITNKNADPSRVFAAGYSSGGCMTNTLLAIYPDVFAGGAALPGFPAGSWPEKDTECQLCGAGAPSDKGGQKYVDIVKGVFQFSGTRPCVQQWVGGSDQYSFKDWLPVVVSQFQILGDLGSETTPSGAPSGWTRKEYKDSSGNVRLQTNEKAGQEHNLIGAVDNNQVVKFLGLDKPTGACGLTTSAGGAPSTGGASSVAGSSSTGGTKAAGGTSSIGAGGTKATGGAVASGGLAAAGGTKASGGAVASGGTKAAGGSVGTGGSKAAGGATAAGGTKATTGGAVVNTGGASSTTSSAATGGNGTTNTTTAAVQTGGNSAVSATGGSSNAGEGGNGTAGGNEALGGASVSNSTPGSSADEGGCGCRVAGKTDASGRLWGLGLLGAAFAAWRRRQRKVS